MIWRRHHTYTWLTAPWTTAARHRRSEHGFTLHEVMIAAAIFTIGLLGLSSMQLTALKLNASAQLNTQLATVAQEKMEEILALPFNTPELQDTNPAVGADQETTYCALYPPEGLRACPRWEQGFVSAYPEPKTRKYCIVTQQTLGGSQCSDANFPPPILGSKVRWDVDVDRDPSTPKVQIAHVNLTASRKTEGKSQPKQICAQLTVLPLGVSCTLSFAILSLLPP